MKQRRVVTKASLQALRDQRAKPEATLEYTMDGPIHHVVTASLESQREQAIALGENAMRDALRKMRSAYELSRHHGQAKADFNHKPRIKP